MVTQPKAINPGDRFQESPCYQDRVKNLVELCILFIYHQNDGVTRHHFDQLKEHNPDATIIPIGENVTTPLPGTIDVGKFSGRWSSVDKWQTVDTLVYRWFENRQLNAHRYVVFEYDCLCTTNLKEYLQKTWGADVACKRYFTVRTRPWWYWFRQIKILPPADRPFAAAVAPAAFMVLSHRALENIVAAACSEEVFCELRLGTAVCKVARSCRLKIKTFAYPIGARIGWQTAPWQTADKGLWHPVKTLDHNVGRLPEPSRRRRWYFQAWGKDAFVKARKNYRRTFSVLRMFVDAYRVSSIVARRRAGASRNCVL